MLNGKSALITGSLDGIGFAIAQALARNGCAVMLNGFGDEAVIEARVQTLKDMGVDACYHGADLSVPSQIEAMVEAPSAASVPSISPSTTRSRGPGAISTSCRWKSGTTPWRSTLPRPSMSSGSRCPA